MDEFIKIVFKMITQHHYQLLDLLPNKHSGL